jgi:1-acyl-sn-glycerol-3-phosphate acyltransferase
VIADSALRAPHPAIERRTPWLVRGFTRYVRRYLRRHFHAVRLARGGRPEAPASGPLVIVLNHPSWWDPLVGAVLAGLFPGREHYVPIEAEALARYCIFERLGFFAVRPGMREGAREFLRAGAAVLARPNAALWVTAQGEFTDPRQRPVRLRAGVGHLLRRLDGGVVLPLALEYPFWQERSPEALARFGAPIPVCRGRDRSVEEWMRLLEDGLTAAQDALTDDAMSRDPQRFEVLHGGQAGVGGLYDLWRRLRARLRGERFQAAHAADDPTTAFGGVS